MKNSTVIKLLVVALAVALAAAWGFQAYGAKQEEVRRQAEMSLNEGIDLFRAREFEKALEVFERIPEGVLDDWHFPYYEATAQVMLKNYQAAAPLLEEALTLNPEETKIMFQLGVVYFKLGNLSLSKGYFASVLEIDPTNEDARGLMDVMSNLEQNQTGADQQATAQNADSGGAEK